MKEIIGKDMVFDLKRLGRQKKKLKSLFKEYNLVESSIAMRIALQCHTGTRKNGFQEVSHQFELVSMVIPLFLHYDRQILDALTAAMFLHDVVEDYPNLYGFTQLKKDFSPTTFEIVKRMTKTKSFKKTENDYIKYYIKLEKHPLSVIAKLLDRIHNYESMSVRTIEFKKKYFQEVNIYMVPMAKRTRKRYPAYEQIITFLIRQLKVLTHLHSENILLEEKIADLSK